ncbi:helix-turn-helix domain-containing protein [Nostoc sp.]|uniref:helix-turn-helix domain-containing protein n=1 Tax=Nostoc sp. TaxID=1180 RepID=UPI002FFD318D
MTITISRNLFWDVYFEIEQTKQRYDPSDEFDMLWQYPSQFGKGYSRDIQLRDGLGLLINNYQLHERLIIKVPEREGCINYGFYVSGGAEGWDGHPNNHFTWKQGQYWLFGNGVYPSAVNVSLANERYLQVNISMSPELFCSFTGNVEGEVSPQLKHLVRKPTQERYIRSGAIAPAMQEILQQILHCPYYGMTKRMYLESKALELMMLTVEEELQVKQGKQNSTALKLNDVDRIHLARNILLRNLDNPPSLIELAKQAGINDCKLKEGFRQLFGTTVFGYLHNYRMSQARSLLVAGQLSVKQIARIVSYASPTSFHAAFRKKFGINPGDYLKRC